MTNSFFPVANCSSAAHTLPPAKAGLNLKAGVGLLTILCLTVFGAGCNTNSSTDKTTRTDSVSRSNGQYGKDNGGMGDDNRQGNDDNGGMMGNDNQQRTNDSRDTLSRGMNHRGMGQKHRDGMNN